MFQTSGLNDQKRYKNGKVKEKILGYMVAKEHKNYQCTVPMILKVWGVSFLYASKTHNWRFLRIFKISAALNSGRFRNIKI
jgi:hypothetical protein